MEVEEFRIRKGMTIVYEGPLRGLKRKNFIDPEPLEKKDDGGKTNNQVNSPKPSKKE